MSEKVPKSHPPPKDLGYTALYVCVLCGKKKRGMGRDLLPMGWGSRDGGSPICEDCR